MTTSLSMSSGVTINSMTFNAGASAFFIETSGNSFSFVGAGIVNNSGVAQRIFSDAGGTTSFLNNSTAGNASLTAAGGSDHPFPVGTDSGSISFSGNSTANNATLTAYEGSVGCGSISFSDAATADNATLTARGGGTGSTDICGAVISFSGNSTAGNATLIARAGSQQYNGGGIWLSGNSTARVEVFGNGYLTGDMSIGSIDGSGNVFLGANNLTVGTNNISTPFSGVISGTGSLAKVGSGVLTLQSNYCIAETVGLTLVTGSTIKLDFTGPSDAIASLKVNGIPQPSGTYGGPLSGAPNILPEFAGLGTVHVGPIPILRNISSRAFVQTGSNVIIGGFIVQGAEPKRVIIRAIGSELSHYGVPNPLGNPTLALHDGTGALIASNDNWQHTIIGGIITENQVADIMATRLEPQDPNESAIIAELPAGNYTAIVRGVNNTTGAALVEVYDLSPGTGSFLSNISTRSFVQTGDNVMIGGFIVAGTGPKRVIVRAIGPELTQYGVPNALLNPTLELHDHTGALIASNDNWQHTIVGGIITSDQTLAIRNSSHAPGDNRESAIVADLPAGNYTAIVRGVNNTTGVALVEVYNLD
jgi:hypothetical protein